MDRLEMRANDVEEVGKGEAMDECHQSHEGAEKRLVREGLQNRSLYPLDPGTCCVCGRNHRPHRKTRKRSESDSSPEVRIKKGFSLDSEVNLSRLLW